MTKTYELRPCPMCGSTDIKHYTTEGRESYRRGVVKCRRCGCQVRAEGGGFELFKELGLPKDGDERTLKDYYLARQESNARAYRLSADRWNGVGA